MRKIPRRTIGRSFGFGTSASVSAMTGLGGYVTYVDGSWRFEVEDAEYHGNE